MRFRFEYNDAGSSGSLTVNLTLSSGGNYIPLRPAESGAVYGGFGVGDWDWVPSHT
ncbi:hypothetical protein GCM10027168_42630 [Streptomyces capparidis]